MAKFDLDELPTRYHVKGNDRVFEKDNPRDMKELGAILRARPPKIFWIEESELKEA